MMGTAEREDRVASNPCTAIVETVAAEAGWEPTEINEPLYERVDPDALESLVASMSDGMVQFTYHGYRVTVEADGTVEVSDREPHR